MKSHEEILKRYIKNQKILKSSYNQREYSEDAYDKAHYENKLIEWILEED